MAALHKQLDNDDYLQAQLENWGQWIKAIKQHGLGYPSKANFVFVVSGDAEFNSTDAEMVEKHMVRLKMIYPEQYQALYYELVQGYSNFEGAQAMRMSMSTFKRYRCMGYSFMAGALGAV